jgi:hypothetical protein
LRAGDYLDEKTFHYLSGSLFDIDTESTGSNEKLAELVSESESREKVKSFQSESVSRSRDKYGNMDENYGLQRFGAIIMDNLNTNIHIKNSNIFNFKSLLKTLWVNGLFPNNFKIFLVLDQNLIKKNNFSKKNSLI